MKIDWFTFVAQLVNFFIFVTLLYFFLFKKIIRLIDAKEKELEKNEKQIEEDKQIAKEKRDEFEGKVKELEKKKEEMKAQAEKEAKQEKEKLLEDARFEIQEKKNEWEKRLKDKKREFLQELEKNIGIEVYKTAQSVLKDLSNVDLQREINAKFLSALQNISDEKKAQFQAAFQSKEKSEIVVKALFGYTDEEKGKITQAISKILDQTPEIYFHEDPSCSFGVSFEFDGYRFGWTAKDYFSKLREKFIEAVEKKDE